MESGQTDLSGLLARTEALEYEFTALGESMKNAEITGSAADGDVTVTLANNEYQSVHISPRVMESCDADELGDLVLAALRDGAEQLRQQADERMKLLAESINRLVGQ